MPETVRGRIFEIQRFSIHDGPGIRTAVFFQGCPLQCVWCHNPEGRPSRSLLSFQPERCVGCGRCVERCAQDAHRVADGVHTLDRDRCRACGECVTECHAQALELVGREATVDEVMGEVLEDRPFYEISGGGLTLSGGEPLLQPAFAAALCGTARSEGLNTAVETCGAVPWSSLEAVLPSVDLFLFDLKETDEERHREYTGAALTPILDNLRRLHAAGVRIRLRLPLIPGYNDRPEHFLAVVELVAGLGSLEGVEIMPYHRLGSSKLARLGLPPGPDLAPPTAATVDGWIDAFERLGLPLVNSRSDADASGKARAHVRRG